MSDEEADAELLDLLRQSLGIGSKKSAEPPELKVLKDAKYVYDNSVDVAVDSQSTKAAATSIWSRMQANGFSKKTWSTHELHPKARDESTINFIFTMDLLNFCFWCDHDSGPSFAVDHHGTRWTGYWSLVAALQRALEEGTLSHVLPGVLRLILFYLQVYTSQAPISGRTGRNVQTSF